MYLYFLNIPLYLVYKEVAAEPLAPGGHNGGNHIESSKADINKETINLLSNPVDKTYSAKEFLRNNGVQNGLSFNARRLLHDDELNPIYANLLLPTLSGHAPIQAGVISSHNVGKYWENEKKLNSPDNIYPFPPLTHDNIHLDLPDNLYPHSSVINDLTQWNENQNECDDHVDIINDIRTLINKWDVDEERYSLKMLFTILRKFIIQNDLQNVSFRVAVIEIGRVLLNDNPLDLRVPKVDEIVEEFKQNDLKLFLQELSLDQQKSLHGVSSKLAILLYNLQNSLIQRGLSQHDINLVIRRVVQSSVPLVGYYFEQECKVKTQKHILQTLEVALNVNLEGIHHEESVQELESHQQLGGHHNLESLENLNSNVALNNENLDLLVNLRDHENPGNLGLLHPGLGNLGNLGPSVFADLDVPRHGRPRSVNSEETS